MTVTKTNNDSFTLSDQFDEMVYNSLWKFCVLFVRFSMHIYMLHVCLFFVHCALLFLALLSIPQAFWLYIGICKLFNLTRERIGKRTEMER